MTDTRTTPTDSSPVVDGVHHVRLVESPVETSAIDRRWDYVPAPKPRALVMRSTTNTHHIATSAIDVRDDVLRDEVPSIVIDACHGVLGRERDAIVQAIEQEDTRPLRRFAAGTTPPAMTDAPVVVRGADRRDVAAIRAAAERRDVGAIRDVLEHASDDALTMALARGSSPSLDGAIACARGSSPSLDEAAAKPASPRMTMFRTRGDG